MTLLLLFALAASPDAGVPSKWKITSTHSSGSDVGNGKIYATSDTEIVVTADGVTMKAEGTNKGKKTKNAWGPKPVTREVRDAIAALLPRLPKESATFSTSKFVNDEGWDNGGLAYEVDGKTVSFSLQQGQGAPVPPEVSELMALVVKATAALKVTP